MNFLNCPRDYNNNQRDPGYKLEEAITSRHKKKNTPGKVIKRECDHQKITMSSHMVEVEVVLEYQMLHHLSQRNSHPKAVMSEIR